MSRPGLTVLQESKEGNKLQNPKIKSYETRPNHNKKAKRETRNEKREEKKERRKEEKSPKRENSRRLWLGGGPDWLQYTPRRLAFLYFPLVSYPDTTAVSPIPNTKTKTKSKRPRPNNTQPRTTHDQPPPTLSSARSTSTREPSNSMHRDCKVRRDLPACFLASSPFTRQIAPACKLTAHQLIAALSPLFTPSTNLVGQDLQLTA